MKEKIQITITDITINKYFIYTGIYLKIGTVPPLGTVIELEITTPKKEYK